MYTQADRAQVQAELKRRWFITAIPSLLVILVAIVVFISCQLQRQEWGWILACCATIAGGAYFLFFHGVYLRPMILYKKHVDFMLDGRKRETIGILQEAADEPCDKDGLDCYALTINVGERNDPEDERLLYYDALIGKPSIPLGTRVKALSCDKIIAELYEV